MFARPLLLGATIATCLGVAGCGGGEELSPRTAAALVRNLDAVEAGVREGACERTRPALQQLEQEVRGLPGEVRPDVRSTLDGGVQNLERLFGAECKQKPEPTPEPETAPEAETATALEAEPETGLEQEPEVDAESELGAESQPESERYSEPGPDSDFEPESAPEPESDTETESAPEPDSEPEPDAGSAPEPEPEPDPEPDPGERNGPKKPKD